jgi:putative flippase GtrA
VNSKRATRRHGRGLSIGFAALMAGATDRLAKLLGLDAEFVRKFSRYFMVGGTCSLIDLAAFAAIIYGSEVHYLIAGTLSFVIGTAVNYFLSVRYVFERIKRSRRSAITLVYFASAIGFAINLAVLGGFIEIVGLHAMLAKIAGTGAAFGWNFGSRYYWIFDK